jgi:3D (Asp-Asp-Asp) domain-containing protein
MNIILLFLLAITDNTTIATTSIYNPVKSQCDADPTLTASGIRININNLRKGKIRYISVSRDLLKRYKYGSYISIKSCIPHYNGCWKIVDTMNKRFKNKIDFLQHTKDRNKPPKTVNIIWTKNYYKTS